MIQARPKARSILDITGTTHGKLEFNSGYGDLMDQVEENQGPGLIDPESSMALGHDAGLIESLRENGFDFFIDYKEL